MLVEFECPHCAGHVCEIWSPKGSTLGIKLIYMHWLLNPGVALVELLGGQRIPIQTYVCRSCPLPLAQRSYEYCPHCYTFQRSDIWSGKNAIANWLGYFCPNCGGSIPCLWNMTSRLLICLTAPLWWLPFQVFKKKLIRAEVKRVRIAAMESPDFEPVDYVSVGTWFGVVASILCSVYMISPLATILDFWLMCYLMLWTTTLGLFVWLPTGWLFGTIMKSILEKRGDPALYLTTRDLAGIDLRPRLGVVFARDPIADLCDSGENNCSRRA